MLLRLAPQFETCGSAAGISRRMQFLRHILTAHVNPALILTDSRKVIRNLHSQPRFPVLPNALDNRIAIFGLIPDLPLATLVA